ncbi:MAG: hypothetical protein M3Q10_06585 [Chloroflexota bacterium]|nr:hypothetical protein [Chloroflexota bacterium]
MITPRQRDRQAPSPATLERIYQLPRDTRSLDDYHKNRNRDLPGLDEVELACEAHRVLSRLSYEPDRSTRGWLIARLGAIEAERRGRYANTTRLPPRPGGFVARHDGNDGARR